MLNINFFPLCNFLHVWRLLCSPLYTVHISHPSNFPVSCSDRDSLLCSMPFLESNAHSWLMLTKLEGHIPLSLKKKSQQYILLLKARVHVECIITSLLLHLESNILLSILHFCNWLFLCIYSSYLLRSPQWTTLFPIIFPIQFTVAPSNVPTAFPGSHSLWMWWAQLVLELRIVLTLISEIRWQHRILLGPDFLLNSLITDLPVWFSNWENTHLMAGFIKTMFP